MITAVVPTVLLRACRPGYPNKAVDAETVDAWIAEANDAKIRTILCLLDDAQLEYYLQAGGDGLLGRYRAAGFVVIHRPVADHQHPAISNELLQRIASDFLAAELPLLIHCSAGEDRTGAVIEYLEHETKLPIFRKNVESLMQKHESKRGKEHFLQVTRLALRLYDVLENEHQLAPRYRSVLWASAMLHDIGTAVKSPPVGHAWRSGKLILEHAGQLKYPVKLMTVKEIATVAALHGIDDATPDNPIGRLYDPIVGLWLGDEIQHELQILAGVLRVADGLDYGLDRRVQRLEREGTTLRVITRGDASTNLARARDKATLLSALVTPLIICQNPDAVQ
jgi:hypothetical protein